MIEATQILMDIEDRAKKDGTTEFYLESSQFDLLKKVLPDWRLNEERDQIDYNGVKIYLIGGINESDNQLRGR